MRKETIMKFNHHHHDWYLYLFNIILCIFLLLFATNTRAGDIELAPDDNLGQYDKRLDFTGSNANKGKAPITSEAVQGDANDAIANEISNEDESLKKDIELYLSILQQRNDNFNSNLFYQYILRNADDPEKLEYLQSFLIYNPGQNLPGNFDDIVNNEVPTPPGQDGNDWDSNNSGGDDDIVDGGGDDDNTNDDDAYSHMTEVKNRVLANYIKHNEKFTQQRSKNINNKNMDNILERHNNHMNYLIQSQTDRFNRLIDRERGGYEYEDFESAASLNAPGKNKTSPAKTVVTNNGSNNGGGNSPDKDKGNSNNNNNKGKKR